MILFRHLPLIHARHANHAIAFGVPVVRTARRGTHQKGRRETGDPPLLEAPRRFPVE